MGIVELQSFDVFKGGVKNRDGEVSVKKNLEAVIKRMAGYVQKNRCEYATRWYSKTLSSAKKQLQSLMDRGDPGDALDGTDLAKQANPRAGTGINRDLTGPGNTGTSDGEGWTTVRGSRAPSIRIPPMVPMREQPITQTNQIENSSRERGEPTEKVNSGPIASTDNTPARR